MLFIIIIFIILINIVLILYLFYIYNNCKNLKNNIEHLENKNIHNDIFKQHIELHKGKYYSMKSGKNEKSLISKINLIND